MEEECCIWMKARVVNFKLCNHTSDCLTCPFDRAMSEAWAKRPCGPKQDKEEWIARGE
jgi:hypothetical protein